MTRRATCSCGQLHLTIEGEPSRIAMCHCLECQRRTGAVISNQARFAVTFDRTISIPELRCAERFFMRCPQGAPYKASIETRLGQSCHGYWLRGDG
jgi:hypothetical protein